MSRSAGIPPEQEPVPGTELEERVEDAAERLAETLGEAPDEQTRQRLFRAMELKLGRVGVGLVEVRDAHGNILGLNPDSLGGRRGVHDKTRYQVLREVAEVMARRRGRYRRIL